MGLGISTFFFGVCNGVLKMGFGGAINPPEKNVFIILKGGKGGVRLQASGVGQPCARSLECYPPSRLLHVATSISIKWPLQA